MSKKNESDFNDEKPEDLLENSLKDTKTLEEEEKWDKICECKKRMLDYVDNNCIPLCDFLYIEKIENFIISLC